MGILSASFNQEQTVELSERTEKEKIIHQANYWHPAVLEAKDIQYDKLRRTAVKIIKVFALINSKYFIFGEEEFDLNVKTRNDVAGVLILGKLEITKQLYTDCHQDLLKILENTSVLNFTDTKTSN